MLLLNLILLIDVTFSTPTPPPKASKPQAFTHTPRYLTHRASSLAHRASSRAASRL